MCAQSSLLSWVDIYLVLAILPWLQVTDSSALGETATLICELSSSLDVLQVTWQVDKDQKQQTIATYSKKYGEKIVNSRANYNLISHKESNISTITISDLKKQDEACYVCIFNAFPHGAYKGKVCLTFPDESGSLPEVKCRNLNPPALGETATLICEFSSSLDVLQVTWQVDKDQKQQTIATYSKKYGAKIVNSRANYNLISHKESNISTITISDLKKQDEACYVCIFNAFPHGAYKSKVCLTFPDESGKLQNIESSREKQQQFDKIFKDNKSTKNDVTRSEVTCSSSDRNIIDIDVKPEEIIDLELTGNDADRKWKFTYEEHAIRPSCTFHTQKLRRRKRALSDEEDGKIIFANCSVTGKAPKIIWENEVTPVSTMEYELKKDGIVTVTSVHGYLQSSLHDQEIKLTCVITSKNNIEDKVYKEEEEWNNVSILFICNVCSGFAFSGLD
ncbi:uncharacterized protein LOC134595259 [Pelobates fuscus]|uniref:uncharacterized protein LOC134595259 n=1 Tax=Pelobates fuscus TaxID=191477 RepID=UPI002FE49937